MSDTTSTLQALSATAQFLRQLARLSPADRMEWLRQQGPAGRKAVMQHLEAQRTELLSRQWQLGQRKRVIHQHQGNALGALERLNLVRRLTIEQLSQQLGLIYTNAPHALNVLWQVASEDANEAQRLLHTNPAHFGALAGSSILGLPTPARLRASRALKTFDFLHFWNLYNQVEHLKVQLDHQLEATRHVRH